MQTTLLFFVFIFPCYQFIPHKANEEQWRQLKVLALKLEIVGPHERWIDDYRSEVGYVVRHHNELKNAPPLADCDLLPSSITIEACRDANRACHNMFEARWNIRNCDYNRDALHECRNLARIYNEMRIAKDSNQSWVCRRRALMQLKELIGDEDYYGGNWPPSMPLWRFVSR